MKLSHICTRQDRYTSRIDRLYIPRTFQAEGFIHCSYKNQIASVAKHHFQGDNYLVILTIKREKLNCSVIEENSEGVKNCCLRFTVSYLSGSVPKQQSCHLKVFVCSAQDCGKKDIALCIFLGLIQLERTNFNRIVQW